MKHITKRLLAFILVFAMMVALLPTISIAAEEPQPENDVDLITAEDNAIVEADVLNDIDLFFSRTAKRSGELTLADYIEATDDIMALVMESETYVEGSIVERGDGFFWQTDTGITCGYFPKNRYEAEQRSAATKAVNTSSLATWNYAAAGKNDVCLVAPMYAEDDTFTEQYVNEALSIAKASGGTAYGLIDSEANVSAIAEAIEKCGVVIFDSHGGTDWQVFKGGSDGSSEADNVSEANTSYIWLSSGTGMTTADCAYVSGPFGTYPHAYKDSYGNYLADGTAFANHMKNNASDNLLWMAICLGMATEGMCTPLRNKGVAVVYGYSQSVTFAGDYLYEEVFWDNMLAEATVASAVSAMKTKYGNWDWSTKIASAYGYYDGYSTIASARENYAAFPIVVSDVDAHPGQRSYDTDYGADSLQTVKSTYTLFSKEPVTITLSSPSGTTTIDAVTNTATALPTLEAPQGYSFAGWTTAPIETLSTQKPTIYTTSYTPSESVTLYALFTYSDGSATTTDYYTKVTSAPADWSGDYVIVNEEESLIFNSSLTTLDATNNYYSVTITNNSIPISDVDAYKVTIDATSNGYSILCANGKYIGQSSNANGMTISASALNNTISLNSDGSIDIVGEGGAHLRFNTTAGQDRFRYYKSSSYSSQQPITLYVKSGELSTVYYTTVPVACEHIGTTTEIDALAPTCTEAGYTAGVFCSNCNTYVSGHEPLDALGHNYNAVATAPTATEQGYTTYTCTACSDSYVSDYTDALGEIYSISFVVPAGVDAIAAMDCGKDGITLPTAGAPTGDYNYTFVGWVLSTVDNATQAPTIYNGTYVAKENTTFYALYTYAVGGSGSSEYILTELASIASTDTVVITVSYDGTVYALSSLNGSSDAPDAITVSVADDKLTAEPAQDLLWNIGGEANAYIIYPEGNTDNWLYCNSTNNGVRVGTGSSNKTFKISSDYLYNIGTSRYLGVYLTNPDWRCYTSTTGNIANQTLAFYVKSDSGTTFYTTVINAACAHENTTQNTVNATCTENGSIQVTCSDCGALISTQTIDATGHSHSVTATTAATCTQDGSITYTCSACGDTYTETIAAVGHSFVDGTCTSCGEAEPAEDNFSGRYYFAGKRSTETYYQYIMGIMDGTRYDIESSELTELPSAITAPESDKIFVIEKNTDGTYRIYAEGISGDAKYLGWTSGNTACFVTVDSALSLKIDVLDSGLYNIHFAANDAERYLSLNGTAANTYAAWYKTGQTKDLALIPVQGESTEHTHNVVYVERQPATCTEDGVIAYYYCALEDCPDFGTCYADEALSVAILAEDMIDPAIGHNMTYTNNNDGTHTYACSNLCDLAAIIEPHEYTNGACPCGAKEVVYKPNENLTLTMSISVGAEMQVFYNVLNSRVKNFESFYIEVIKDVAGGESVKTVFSLDENNVTAVTNASGAISRYMATYTGIYAMEMGDNFTATLYAVAADGTVNYGPSISNSIKKYLMDVLADESNSDTLLTLAVDMLNYGAAAQINFNYDVTNLVNADLTDAQKALGTQGLPDAVDGSATTGDGVRVITSVSVQSKVMLYVTFLYKATADSRLKVIIKNASDGTVLDELAPTEINTNNCKVIYDNVGARQMRDLISIELYDNGVLVSKTVTWSVESYVALTRADSTSSEALINAVNALLVYGDSAAAYLKETGQ